MSTNTIDSTAATATSQRRPAKPEGGRKSANSAKAKPTKKSQAAAKPKVRRANKRAEVIDLMRRAGGATLTEIMETTGWQRHTARGFVSLLGSKGGLKVESTKSASGERTYRVTK